MQATIAWVSDGERAKPRRRRGRRRGRAAGPPVDSASTDGTSDTAAPLRAARPQPAADVRGPRRRPPGRLRTVHETSAGGLVIDGLDRPREEQLAALIGRMDRRGRMFWSLPKGAHRAG